MKVPTGSTTELASHCLHPFTSGVAWPAFVPSAKLDYGNAVHDVAEAGVRGERADVDAAAARYHLGAEDRDRLIGTSVSVAEYVAGLRAEGWLLAAEVPIAYDVARSSARRLVSRHHRDYSARRQGEMALTLDVLGVRPGAVLVADWKSGRRVSKAGETSWQMLLGGLAGARLFGSARVDTRLVYVDERGASDDRADLDAFDIETAASDLKDMWTRLHAGPQPPQPGWWCTGCYCPLVGQCAATRAALAEVGGSAAIALDTAEQAARVWAMIPQAEAAIKAAKERLREMAGRQPISLPNGRRLVIVEQARESIALTAETLGIVPPAAVDVSTTKAAIERAVGRAGAREVVAALREAGAMKTTTYTRLEEREE